MVLGMARIQDIFTSGHGGAHTYRLPSLVVANDGKTLLVLAHGRLRSARDVSASSVFLRRSLDGGKSFGSIRQVTGDPHNQTMIAQQAVHDKLSDAVILLTNRVPTSRCTAGRFAR